jgi:glycosyltransferase involved in cell wall biosynthesis
VGRTYPFADAVVAVSSELADDLSAVAGLPRGLIRTVYNPVVGPELPALAAEPAGHPWLRPGGPPVVLGAGRLVEQKDFPTLLRAFALVRRERPARLVILGEGPAGAREGLAALAAGLGVAADLDLPGFVANPYAYMARAAAFALSSLHEGLPGVLIQALACGCPVVSTDCPSGPREILDGGRYGRLVPVGDHEALARAILACLDDPSGREERVARAAAFGLERAVDRYLELIGRPAAKAEGLRPVGAQAA